VAIIKQGGSNPYDGQVMTTQGYKNRRPPRCQSCGGFKEGLYVQNGYGQFVCPDCAKPSERVILTGCDPESCACGEPCDGDEAA